MISVIRRCCEVLYRKRESSDGFKAKTSKKGKIKVVTAMAEEK